MTKKTILIILAVVLVAGIGFGVWYYINNRELSAEKKALNEAGQSSDAISANASKGVLPDTSVDLNPVNNIKIANPADATNPFKGVTTNPFK